MTTLKQFVDNVERPPLFVRFSYDRIRGKDDKKTTLHMHQTEREMKCLCCVASERENVNTETLWEEMNEIKNRFPAN